MSFCRLALEDGSVFTGHACGAPGTRTGEAVFNTAMAGYQEVLTDPSYLGQIVTMTYPLMGNYGIHEHDIESGRLHLSGFVVKELPALYSHPGAMKSLDAYLKEHEVIGLVGVDTRAITRRLREHGALRAVISTEQIEDAKLCEQARSLPLMTGQNLAARAAGLAPRRWGATGPPFGGSASVTLTRSCETPFSHPVVRQSLHAAVGATRAIPPAAQTTPFESPTTEGVGHPDQRMVSEGRVTGTTARAEARGSVVALDCGIKYNILRSLAALGCEVTCLSGLSAAEEILEHRPQGILVGNGPGDPRAVEDTIATLRKLIGRVPIFGICLGHQLLACALGADIYKLKFGHHGVNHPVRNLATGRVEITSQNHGFAVDDKFLDRVGAVATHINLNDHSLEGFAHRTHPLFAVQYHPESAPGPHDSRYLFEQFLNML